MKRVHPFQIYGVNTERVMRHLTLSVMAIECEGW